MLHKIEKAEIDRLLNEDKDLSVLYVNNAVVRSIIDKWRECGDYRVLISGIKVLTNVKKQLEDRVPERYYNLP